MKCVSCGTPGACQKLGCANLTPAVGSRWTTKDWPHGSVAVVLGVVAGYVVWRRKGAMPDLRHVNQWHAGFTPAVAMKSKHSVKPNVRVKPAPTVGRAGQQAQNGPQAQRLMASATRRWGSASTNG